MGGYGASFQNKDMFSGGKNNFDDDKYKQNNPVNVTAFNKDKDFGKSSSVSPVRSKPEAVQEQTKLAEPAQPAAQPKKTSLFGGGKKDRLNPFTRKSSQPKTPEEINKSSETPSVTQPSFTNKGFGGGFGQASSGSGFLGNNNQQTT